MRAITTHTERAWENSVKSGDTRPVVRATLEWGRVRSTTYNTDDMQGGDFPQEGGQRQRKGQFRSIHFDNGAIREVRNIRSMTWSRSVDQDVSEATLTILNAGIAPIGSPTVSVGDDFELPGLFTFSRGTQPNRWGYDTDYGWSSAFVPDRLVRTYEGYGADDTKAPGEDPNLYASGVWLIDSVDYNANGDVVLKMRDVGRLLIDHIVFPPVIPADDYPLEWSKIRTEMVESREAVGGQWEQPVGKCSSSNDYYVGKGIIDKPQYVNQIGGVQGHYPNHAWRAGGGTGNEKYWLSTGQASHDDVVWWQVDFDQSVDSLGAIKVSTRSGPYRVYVSVGDDSEWYGKRKIPYEVTTEDVDIEAGIRYVDTFKSEHGFPLEVTLPRLYGSVTRVRLTITRLRELTPAVNYPWRAGLRNVQVYTGATGFELGETAQPIGNYRDFSQIIRWVGAWAGWYWPKDATMRYEHQGEVHDFSYGTQFVSSLPKGRTFGAFQWCGTAGKADITADQFDKQPLLDVISHVREITGFRFWIDEAGAMQWREPNIFSPGNWLMPSHLEPRRVPERTNAYITLDEEDHLLSYSTTLSSANVRERVFVGDANGKHGAVVKGYNPNGGTGLMRVAGWTDSHWETNKECYVAADLIVAQQMFDYRRSTMTIPANPAIQVDDQIRILERVTSETFFHYVLSISSELDMEEGTWTYNLETHWLGPDIDQAFVLDATKLGKATQQALAIHGGID